MTNATILIGMVCAILGVWGTLATWPLIRQVVVAVLLMALMLGGVLAILIGLSEVVDRRTRRRTAPSGGGTGTEPRA